MAQINGEDLTKMRDFFYHSNLTYRSFERKKEKKKEYSLTKTKTTCKYAYSNKNKWCPGCPC